jgi:hypothetical protein
MEDRWAKLEEIVRRVVSQELDARGMKPKAKVSFMNGRWIGVTEEQLEAWKLAYPSVNIQQQLQLASAWILSNPNLAPKSNYPRFLNTWLSRQQNQASLHAIPTARTAMNKTCAYCERESTGSVNGYACCDTHSQKAMDGERPPRLKLA